MTLPPLPEPAGFRTRYRSEPGMIGHYPWTYADSGRRRVDRPEHEYEDLYTAAQVAEALSAQQAQIERLRAALVAAEEAMNYMGDILNGMDAVEPEDEAKTTPAFLLVRNALTATKETP